MKPTIIIQARMSSRRFAGKVLHPINGKPLLDYLMDSLSQSRSIDKIMVGTSTDTSDDAIEKYCQTKKIECVRGDLDNVIKRFEKIIKKFNLSSFVRISADSPLLDYRLVDQASSLFESGRFDIVTNVLKRTFPKGQSVEVISAPIFLKTLPFIKDPADCEHVTTYFYRHRDRFSICNFESPENMGALQLSVDTKADGERIERLMANLSRPHWTYNWSDFVSLLNE